MINALMIPAAMKQDVNMCLMIVMIIMHALPITVLLMMDVGMKM
jgi:hypothetical protein